MIFAVYFRQPEIPFQGFDSDFLSILIEFVATRSLIVDLVYLSAIGLFSTLSGGPAGGRAWLVGKKEPTLTRIADLLLREDILLDLEVSGKSQLIEEIGRHMERTHAMPHASVAPSLSHREQIGSTGLGQGVAIPHARVKDLDRILVAYARLRSPIPFDAPDGKPVTDILVLLVPKQATEEHLRILAQATQMLSDRRFRERLHLCQLPLQVKQLFDTWPENTP
jgi:PTS system nitrogen regulatory IIA component